MRFGALRSGRQERERRWQPASTVQEMVLGDPPVSNPSSSARSNMSRANLYESAGSEPTSSRGEKPELQTGALGRPPAG